MNVSHVKLKNWRNFRSVDTPLSRRVFIIGLNASGKSNFLDAFRFLRDVAKSEGGGLRKIPFGKVSWIVWLGQQREPGDQDCEKSKRLRESLCRS